MPLMEENGKISHNIDLLIISPYELSNSMPLSKGIS